MWLITGGSGFIGTNFSKLLMKMDYDFKIYDLQRSRYLPKSVETIKGDIRDKKKLTEAMKGSDVVFHLATVPPSVGLPKAEIYDIDVNGTRNVLEAAKQNNVERVVFTSSASHVYGLVDPDSCPLKEDCKLNPINEYGRNKVLAEELCQKMAGLSGTKIIVLRLSMILGPYDFDPILMENALSVIKGKRIILPGDGSSKAQSMHVKDVNTALLASAEKSNRSFGKHEVFNISGNEILSMDKWMQLMLRLTDSKSKVSHMPLALAKGMVGIAWGLRKTKVHPSYLSLMAQDQYFDISKAERILKWKPKYSVETALQDTIPFLKD